MQVTYIALAGLNRVESLLNQTASQMARSPQDTVSLSDEALSLVQAKDLYQVNLDTIKVADEMQKSTISLLA
jgi:hypothetical protein